MQAKHRMTPAMSRDGWAGLAILAASLVLFALTLGLKDSPLVPVGPGFYPRIVLALTALLSLWLVFSGWQSKTPPSGQKQPVDYRLVVLMFVVFGIYCGALPFLGFRISTALYVGAANALLDPPRGAKGWLRVLLLAVLTALLTHLVFERYLSVLLPRGRWTDF